MAEMKGGFAWGYKREHLELIRNYTKFFTIICLFSQKSEENLNRKNKLENTFKIFTESENIEQKVIKCYTVEHCIEQIQQIRDQKIILIISSNEPLEDIFSSYPNVQYITSFESNIENSNYVRQLSENKSWLSYLSSEIMNKSIKDFDCEAKKSAIQQLIIDFLLRSPCREAATARKDFINYSRSIYNDDTERKMEIDVYEKDHWTRTSIQWYTCKNFIHRIVNKTFRQGKINSLYKIRYFCCGIYSQMVDIYVSQLGTRLRSIQNLFRGRRISQKELNFFNQYQGTYVISNSFVSTSTAREVADRYSGKDQQLSDDVGVIFSIIIKVKQTNSKPIALIERHSLKQYENEVLLPPGIVLRIGSVTKNADNIYEIVLVRDTKEENYERKFYEQKRLLIPLLVMASVVENIISGEDINAELFDLIIDELNKNDRTIIEQQEFIERSDTTLIDVGYGSDTLLIPPNRVQQETSILTRLEDLFRNIITYSTEHPRYCIIIIVIIIIIVVLCIVLSIIFSSNSAVAVAVSG